MYKKNNNSFDARAFIEKKNCKQCVIIYGCLEVSAIHIKWSEEQSITSTSYKNCV